MNQTRKDVLNGWKEIAAYLGRDPRTVERWEKQRSLPVRRLPGSGRATVYALTSELDRWLASAPLREPEPFTVGSAATLAGGPAHAPERESLRPLPEAAGAPASRDAEEPETAEAHETGGRTRRAGLRWALVMALVLLACGAGLAVAGWRHKRVAGLEPGADLATVTRSKKMVPSSPMLGVEELYLRGCYQTEMRTPESLHRAEDAFSQAIAKDPHYAPAFAGLANVYLLEREDAMLPDAQAYTLAKKVAGEALALSPDLPQAHAAMGFVDFFGDWNAVEAERQFQTALKVDPDLPLAHHWYGSVLMHEGRFREALAQLEVAQRLDPTSAAILTLRALALGLNGRQPEGYELLQQAVSGDRAGQSRNPAVMHGVMATLSLLLPRNVPRYLTETMLAAEVRQDPETVATMRAATEVYQRHGEQAMWRALLEGERKRHPGVGPTYSMARYEAELGQMDQALNDLRELFSRHDPALIGISVDPLFASLRREPRFAELRGAMGLPGADEA